MKTETLKAGPPLTPMATDSFGLNTLTVQATTMQLIQVWAS